MKGWRWVLLQSLQGLGMVKNREQLRGICGDLQASFIEHFCGFSSLELADDAGRGLEAMQLVGIPIDLSMTRSFRTDLTIILHLLQFSKLLVSKGCASDGHQRDFLSSPITIRLQ